MDKLTELYKGVILDHNNTPQYFEKRPTAQHVIEAYNPLCGDKFKLFVDIQNDVIVKATFHGYGCAISKAATSVLLSKIQGQKIETVLNQINAYFYALNSEDVIARHDFNREERSGTEGVQIDENIRAFQAVRQFPERMTCATLSWQAAKDFLIKKD